MHVLISYRDHIANLILPFLDLD